MTLSMAGFALNDAAMKAVFQDVALMPAIMLRGAFMVVLLGGLCLALGAFRWRPNRRDSGRIALRIAAEVATTYLFLSALANMPIANATAILQATPLAVTLGAALFLGEAVGWRRGLALLLGFVGVMIIVRPGTEGFDVHALFALGAVLTMVVRDLVTRGFSKGVPSVLVSFITSVMMMLMGAAGTAALGMPQVTLGHLGLILAASLFLVVGYVFSVRTMRVGDIGFTAMFRYSILLWALVLGVVVFDEIPDALTLLGAALVVGTGLYTFWRERRLARRGR